MGGEKPCTARRRAALHGITPAWAGKSKISRLPRQRHRDHPRVGGEKDAFSSSKEIVQGSPPRGRGKVLLLIAGNPQKGITPAWAGKRQNDQDDCSFYKDHPRVGGEKGVIHNPVQGNQGSPPRGRGKADQRQGREPPGRITPAWAGKRLKRSHRSGIFISGPIPFHSVLHRPAGSGGSRAGRDGSPAGQPQNTGPA